MLILAEFFSKRNSLQ